MRQVRFEPSLTYCLLISLNLMLFLHVSVDPLDRVFQMSASQIAKLHFEAAISAAEAANLDVDTVCRALLGLVISKYLQSRTFSDVQSELRFVAENCDPDTDFMFMRP